MMKPYLRNTASKHLSGKLWLFIIALLFVIAKPAFAETNYDPQKIKLYATNIRDYINNPKYRETCSGLTGILEGAYEIIVDGTYRSNPGLLDKAIDAVEREVRSAANRNEPCVIKANLLAQNLRSSKGYNSSMYSASASPAPKSSAKATYNPIAGESNTKSAPEKPQKVDLSAPSAKLTMEQITEMVDARNKVAKEEVDRKVDMALASISQANVPDENAGKMKWWVIGLAIAGLLFSIASFLIVMRQNRTISDMDDDLRDIYEKTAGGGITKIEADGMLRNTKTILEAEINALRRRLAELNAKIEEFEINGGTKTDSSPASSFANVGRGYANNGNNVEVAEFEYYPAPDATGVFKNTTKNEHFIPTKTIYKVTPAIDGTSGTLELVDDYSTIRSAQISFFDSIRPACEPENPYDASSTRDIRQTTNGLVIKDSDTGDWRVLHKIRIRYV